jgi:hypothetical protein
LHTSASPHSQHPVISFSWQHLRIWQNGGAATVTVPLLAPELHHSPDDFLTLLVIRKGFPERRIRNGCGGLVILYTPQFFPKIAGKIGDLPGIPVAVKAAEPAIHNHLKVLFHNTGRVGI